MEPAVLFMRLLIIEDDRKTAALLRASLQKEGCEVNCVFDGASGLGEARKGGFDALLVDIMLPKLDGLSLVRRLRSHGAQRHHSLRSPRGLTHPDFRQSALRRLKMKTPSFLARSRFSGHHPAATSLKWSHQPPVLYFLPSVT